MSKNNHYYLLPSGEKFNNMKDARIASGLKDRAFKAMLKKGTITKIINNSDAHSNDNKQNK